MRKVLFIALLCAPLLGGCVKGIFPDPEAEAKKVEEEAAATGTACRQAGRSLEDCFVRNEGLNRNGAVRGWREMDEYMRQNKIESQPPGKDLMDKESALRDAKDSKNAPEAKKSEAHVGASGEKTR
jgi:hypothetical protein